MKECLFTVFILSIGLAGCTKKGTVSRQSAVKIQEISTVITEKNVLYGKNTGRGASMNPQYKAFEELLQAADEAQLIQLTDHPNGVMRAYAFWGLAKLQSESVPIVLKKHAQDQEQIKTIFGDIAAEVLVRDFMFELVSGNDIDPSCFRLNQEQIQDFQKLINKK